MKRFHVILPVMTGVVIGLGSQAFAQSMQSSTTASAPAVDPWGNARTPTPPGSSMANPGTAPTSKTAPASTAQTPQDQKRADRKAQRVAERTAARNSCREQAKAKSIPHEGMRDFMKTCRTTMH